MTSHLLDILDHFLEAAAVDHRDRALAPIEQKLQRAVANLFRKQGRLFLARFAKLKRRFPDEKPRPAQLREAVDDEDWDPLFDAAAEETARAFERLIEEAVQAALTAGAQAAIADLRLDTAFTLKNPRAVEYLTNYAADRVAGVNDTTRGYLKTVITQAVEEGWSYQRTARAITDRYAQFAVGVPQEHLQSRAELIAVTEAGEAYEAGSMIVAQDLAAAGLEMEKSWLAVRDGRSEDGICAPNAAQGWIPLDQDFQSGHSRPLGHPACRCTALTRMKRERPGA
jgi:hypothetical protein